jgi:hypothetical protein
MRVRLGFIWQKMCPVTGLYEHDKEHTDSVKGAEFPRATERP